MRANIMAGIRRLVAPLRELVADHDEMSVARRYIVLASYFLGVASNLANLYVTPFYLMLGADNAFIGLLGVVPTIGNLLQVFSATILERFPRRRNLLIGGRIANYFLNIVAMGVIPYIGGPSTTRLTLVLLVNFLMTLLAAIITPGISIWQIKNIPAGIRSRFMSWQTALYLIIIIPVSLGGSRLVDWFIKLDAQGEHYYFLLGTGIMRGLAVVFAALEVACLFRIKEHPNEVTEKAPGILEVLVAPLRERRYLVNIALVCLYTFPGAFAGSYYTFYLYENLKLSLTTIALFSALSTPLNVVLYPLSARIITRVSYYRALYVLLPVYTLVFFTGAFVTRNNYIILYSLSMLLGIFCGPGLSISFYNIQFDSLPKKNQTNYLGFYTAVSSLVSIVSSLLGRGFIRVTSALTGPAESAGSGVFARTPQGLTIRLLGVEMVNRQYIYLGSAVLLVICTGLIFVILGKSGIAARAKDNPTGAGGV